MYNKTFKKNISAYDLIYIMATCNCLDVNKANTVHVTQYLPSKPK